MSALSPALVSCLLIVPSVLLLDLNFLNNVTNCVLPEDYCVECNCKNPRRLPLPLSFVVPFQSPLDAVHMSKSSKSNITDNCCYTYFPNESISCYTTVISCVYDDGTSEQYFSVEQDVPLYPGILAADSCQETNAIPTPGIDTIVGLTPKMNLSDSCKKYAISLATEANLVNDGFDILPQKFPYQCVTKIGNLTCVNAYKISAENSIVIS